MLPPALQRAIAESTSPFCANPSANVLRSLEVYLADPRTTDAVYEGFVSRACAQPISLPLVERVVALLKAWILRYLPSQDVLQLLEDFCFRVNDVAGLSGSGRKSAQYVRACLRKLRGDRPTGVRNSRGSDGSLHGGGASLRGLLGRSREDLGRLAPGRISSVKISVAGAALGRANDRYAAADALPSPTDPDAAGLKAVGLLPAFLQHVEGRGFGRGWEDLRVPSVQQAALGAEPAWAVPGRPVQLPPPPPGATAARAQVWMQHLPDLAPRVTLAGSAAGTSTGSLSLSGAPPINLATIHRCVLDLEEQDIGRHLAEVLGEARAEAQQLQSPTPQNRRNASRAGGRAGGQGGGGFGARDGGKGRRGRPARLLFHHPPYNRAEQLPMTESDVAVVVEAVCGVRAASALAAVHGPPASADEEVAAMMPGQAEGMWQAAFEEDAEFGQMCGSILMKLIVDMWTRGAPVGSYMLVLRMLRAAIRSDQPSTRARAFDIVYNLSVHSAMLRGGAEEAALAAAAAEVGSSPGGVAGFQMPWQVCASAPVSPFISGGGGGGGSTPPPAPRPVAVPLATPPPATATAVPQTPNGNPAAVGVSTPTFRHHVASHSLGLVGSAMLDSSGSMTAMPPAVGLPQGPRAAKAKGAAEGASGIAGGTSEAGPPASRRDAPEAERLAPSSPSVSPVKAPVLGGAAGGIGGVEGAAPSGFDRWLRALLFQLLCDLREAREYSEEVWRAAMGCVAQLCSHGGCWVAPWVQHLPPAALSALLRAACNLNWSQELYGHLLKLVPCVIIRAPAGSLPPHPRNPQQCPLPGGKRPDSAFAAPSAVGPAAAAAADDDPALDATAAAAEGAELSQRLAAFGGLDEILFHFVRAPTPDSRASLLTALAFCCCGGDAGGPGGGLGGSGSVSSSGERLPSGGGGRSPRSSGSNCKSGQEGGPSGALAVLQGLHLDSVCLTLRAALQRPWRGMSGRLADVLASAYAVIETPAVGLLGAPPSPSASVSGSADYTNQSLPAGVASPIAVRALLRPLLESLEVCLADSIMVPQVDEIRTHVDVSVAHIASGGGGSPKPGSPPLTPASVAAAWRCFKDVVGEGCVEARQLSTHWLHQLLSAACRTCQGQIPLLSPLTLKTVPEISTKLSSSVAAAAGAAHSPPLPKWNVSMADALLHVVREAPLGCELLMDAISRVAADQKAPPDLSDSQPSLPPPPLLGVQAGLGLSLGVGGGTPAAVVAVGGEEPALSACRRVMWLYYVGLQWMLQCGSAEARMPAVVQLADTVLTALLQPDPAVLAARAAMAVAAAGPGAGAPASAVAAGGSGRGGNSPSPLASGSRNNLNAAPPLAGAAAASGQALQPQQMQPQSHQSGPRPTSLSSAAAAAAAACAQEPGGGMLVSQQLLSGLLALDPDALSCTPPELLVALLQQCSQTLQDAGGRFSVSSSSTLYPNGDGLATFREISTAGGGLRSSTAYEAGGFGGSGAAAAAGGFRSMQRGFIGRPCAAVGAAQVPLAPAAGSAGGGVGAPGRVSLTSVRTSAVSLGDGGGGGGGGGFGIGGAVGEVALSGAAVGPWQDDWQDRRLALLLLLIARCSLDPEAFAKYSLSHVVKAQLSCEDLRCRYYAGVYLLKHWMLNLHDKYWRTLRHIIGTAQQLNDERLLDNPYLQMRTMLNVDHA